MRTVILDDQGGYERDAEVGEVGSIAIFGPNLFAGYTDPAREASLWLGIDGKRWLNSGDLGRQDEDGYFWLVGRRKELIIRGGHNVDPSMIEEALAGHSAVALAAAVGRPDAHAGELPVCFVQLRPGASASADELLTFAKTRISERAAWPKAVHVLDALPLTGVGKVFKPELVAREIADVVKTEAGNLGLEPVLVNVEQTADRGPVARIGVQRDPELLRRALGCYTFAFEMEAATS